LGLSFVDKKGKIRNMRRSLLNICLGYILYKV
jgi:hypothetical protein